jgi:hypothetical protein
MTARGKGPKNRGGRRPASNSVRRLSARVGRRRLTLICSSRAEVWDIDATVGKRLGIGAAGPAIQGGSKTENGVYMKAGTEIGPGHISPAAPGFCWQ